MANGPIVNPTPRQAFQANKKQVEYHRDVFSAPATNVSIDTALLQYQRQMCDARDGDGNKAAANHFKLQGAQEFVNILRHLGEHAAPSKTTAEQSLDYRT
jgi:hypothetical protein